jgi:hypothetical protein
MNPTVLAVLDSLTHLRRLMTEDNKQIQYPRPDRPRKKPSSGHNKPGQGIPATLDAKAVLAVEQVETGGEK